MLRTAALILIGAPAFGAAGLLLIRLHPGNLPVRIVGYAGILFFGGCFAAGLLVLRRLARNSEALTLTPEKLTVRQPNGREYALKWNEIRSFREADINGQPGGKLLGEEKRGGECDNFLLFSHAGQGLLTTCDSLGGVTGRQFD